MEEESRKYSRADELEFYKQKVKRLEGKYDDLWEMMNKCKSSHRDHESLLLRLKDASSELTKSQQAISDLQIFLLEEREENLRLAAENDEIKIQNFENGRIIDELLMAKSAGSQLREETTREKSVDALQLEVKSLQTQLENLQTLFRNKVNVLLKDREVVAEERAAETARLEKQIDYLIKTLCKTEKISEQATRHLLVERERYEKEVEIWRRDKEIMQEQILLKNQENLTTNRMSTTCRISSNASKQLLLERLENQEKLSETYRLQSKHLLAELGKWKERATIAEECGREKVRKLTSDLDHLKHRYEDLDRRRLLEAEGFRTDIRLLRQRISEISRAVVKVKSEIIASKKADEDKDEDEQVKKSSQLALYHAKIFEKEVASLKGKFSALAATIGL